MISSIFLFLSQLLCFCFSHTPFHQTDPLIRDCGKDFCIHRGKFSTGFLLICLFCAHVSTTIIFLVFNNNFMPTTPNSSFPFLFLNTAWCFSGRDLELELCPAPQAQSWQGLAAVPLLTSKSLLSITVYITTVPPVKTYKSLGAILENCHR